MYTTPNGASQPTPAEIASRAYALWLRDCRVHGRDVEHWLQAEYELRREREAALPAPPPPRLRAALLAGVPSSERPPGAPMSFNVRKRAARRSVPTTDARK